MASNLNIHPEVEAVIKPIIYNMGRIYYAQQTNPILGPHNEPEEVKKWKRMCVHIIFEHDGYVLKTKKTQDGKLVCAACGRTINTKFDANAVQKIVDAIEVINQTVLFGMLNNLNARPLATLIDLKEKLPGAAQLQKELNEYVKRDNSSAENAANIGAEYAIPNYRSITEM